MFKAMRFFALPASLLLISVVAAQEKKEANENMYREAKLGDWTEFKSKDVLNKQTVIAKTDESLTIRIDQTVAGKASEPIEYKVDLKKPFPPPSEADDAYSTKTEVLEKGKETLTVAGQKLECEWKKIKTTITTKSFVKDTDKVYLSKVWHCKEVPLGGSVKTESVLEDGTKVGAELSGFGRGK